MTSYYYWDESESVKYYEPTMVVEFRQLESTDKDCETEDMRVFMVYDEDEDLMYVYGSRKSESHMNQVEFVKTFDNDDQLYDFLNVRQNQLLVRASREVHERPDLCRGECDTKA